MKQSRKPTHHILFGDNIPRVSQGWRYAIVTKVGRKWVYFMLFEGTEQQYKTTLGKWNDLQKKDLNEQVAKTPNQIEGEVDDAERADKEGNEGSPKASRKKRKAPTKRKKLVSRSLRPKRKGKRSSGD